MQHETTNWSDVAKAVTHAKTGDSLITPDGYEFTLNAGVWSDGDLEFSGDQLADHFAEEPPLLITTQCRDEGGELVETRGYSVSDIHDAKRLRGKTLKWMSSRLIMIHRMPESGDWYLMIGNREYTHATIHVLEPLLAEFMADENYAIPKGMIVGRSV